MHFFFFFISKFSVLQFDELPISSSILLAFSIIPVKTYKNADIDKFQIPKQAKGKSGVYRWTNKTNGKIYIGSSVNLERRLERLFFYLFPRIRN